MATVRQSGGDYGSLNAALAAAESIIDIDQAWTVADTTACVFGADAVITVSGAAKHLGYWDTAQNHYRLSVSSGGHALTLNGAYTATIDGIAIEQAGTGTSDECFRCIPGTADTVTIKNSLFRCSTTTNQQDCIYTGYNTSIGTINIEQCSLSGAGRGGLHSQNAFTNSQSATFNLNSCTISKCGGTGTGSSAGTAGGGIYFSIQSSDYIQTNINCNVHNCIVVDNAAYVNAQDFLTEAIDFPPAFNVSYSIDSDGSIATDTDGGTGNLASRTATDSDTPGAGNWVVFEDITSAPYDLRLKDNAENDAQDAHAAGGPVHGLTIPALDIVGTSRPQNTLYDIGAFEIAAGGGVPGAVDLSTMLWTYAQTPLSAEAASSVSMAVMAYSYTQPPIPAEAAVSVISQPMLWTYAQTPLSGDAASSVALLPIEYVYNWLPLGVGQSASVDLAPMLWTYHQDPLSVGVAASVSLLPMAYAYSQDPLSADAASSVVTATMAWTYQQNPLVPAVGSGVTLSPMLWTYHQDPLSASTPATVDLLPMLWSYFQDPLSAEAAVAIDLDPALWAYHQDPLAPAVGSGITLAPMLWSYTQDPLSAGVPGAVDLGAMLWTYHQDPLTAEAAAAADLDPMLWRYFSSLDSPLTGMQIADPGAYYLGIGYNSHFKGLGYNARFK